MAGNQNDEWAKALAGMDADDTEPTEAELEEASRHADEPVEPRAEGGAPPAPATAAAAAAVRPVARASAPVGSPSAAVPPVAPPPPARPAAIPVPNRPTAGRPTAPPAPSRAERPAPSRGGGPGPGKNVSASSVNPSATASAGAVDDDAMMAPAPDASVFAPKRKVAVKAKIIDNEKIGLRRTMIPMLLVLGAGLPIVGGLRFFVNEDSAFRQMPMWFTVMALTVGLAMAALAVINMLAVKRMLDERAAPAGGK